MPDHDGGSDEPLRAGLREDSHVPVAGGIWDTAGWRVGVFGRGDHALLRLAAGEDDGLGARVSARLPEDGPMPARVPRARGEDEYPVPRKRGEPSGFPGGAGDHGMAGADAGVGAIRAAQGSRDEAADVSGRGDCQPESDGGGQTGAAAHRCSADAAARGGCAAGRYAADAGGDGAGEVRRVDAVARAAAADGHYVSRRAPIAAGDARAVVRYAAHRELRGAQAAQSIQPGDVGRGDVRRGHAVSARGSVAAAEAVAGVRAEHLFSDAAAGVERGGLYGVSGQRGGGIHSRGGGAGHRHFPHFRFVELAAEHEGVDGGGAQDGQGLRGGGLLYGRHTGRAAG